MTRTSREGALLDPYYRNPIYAQGETLSILARYWAVEDLTSLYIKLFIQKIVMKHFILIITIILLGTFSNKSFAQSYVPEKGKVIVFYPVSDYYKQKVGGFDCFYNTSEVYKNNKTKVKLKNRFMQQNGLTPFTEIEEHTFTVVNYMVENKEAKKLEKKFFLYFLRPIVR